MAAIRIMIVDDSVVIRKMLRVIVESDPDLEVAGTASNGQFALDKIDIVNPDVMILDIEMPEMNGLETLERVRKIRPHQKVIMCSTLTQRGSMSTLDALALGAGDYVTKPEKCANRQAASESIKRQLIPKIKALCGQSGVESGSPSPSSSPPSVGPARKVLGQPSRVELVVIGCSTGGPMALDKIIPHLSGDFRVPVAIVQHMPPVFTKQMAARLDRKSKIAVREAEQGAILEPGTAWMAPGDFHLEIHRQEEKAWLHLQRNPPECFSRPAVDVLFRTAAKAYGPGVLAVVLTGMGSDGSRGAKPIHDAGGQIIVQDEQSSVVWGMPGHVAQAGLAEAVLPIEDIVGEIRNRVDREPKRSRRSPGVVG